MAQNSTTTARTFERRLTPEVIRRRWSQVVVQSSFSLSFSRRFSTQDEEQREATFELLELVDVRLGSLSYEQMLIRTVVLAFICTARQLILPPMHVSVYMC